MKNLSARMAAAISVAALVALPATGAAAEDELTLDVNQCDQYVHVATVTFYDNGNPKAVYGPRYESNGPITDCI